MTDRSPPPAVQFTGVTKRFGRETAVDDVTVAFASGTTTVVLGPSGCGKSTLLKLSLGLIKPDAGEVTVGGRVPDDSDWPAIRRRWGYVPSDGGLFPHLTARRNMTLTAGEPAAGRLDELCELTRLDRDLLSKRPGQLSAGQRQRVAVMRALVHRPEILLLDEPTAALDPLVRASLRADLAEIVRAAGTTVVLVTHDLDEAALFAGRIVLMRAGRVVQAGTVAELVDTPADPFVTEFVEAQRSHWPRTS